MNALQRQACHIIQDNTLTHEQATNSLAALPGIFAASTLHLPEGFIEMKDAGLLCDMGEGTLPYCPRYILPDYAKLIENGCDFLRLPAPRTLFEAIQTLEIFYRHVPSITHYPVYLGNVDKLLEPFIEDEAEARFLIKNFLFFLSRSIPDSYCHMNIGPEETRAAHIILDTEIELQEAIPSITLLYDPVVTPSALAEKAAQCALLCAKPSFANHVAYTAMHPEGYGIASCYNALPIGGGAFTLSRVVLSRVAKQATNYNDFLERLLPKVTTTLCSFIEEKIRFLVNESHFFNSNFLVNEGFISLDRFIGMVGVVGLCECVNILNKAEGLTTRFGHSETADARGREIMQTLSAQVASFKSKWCKVNGHRFSLHAQVGIDADIGISPGARIPIGEEIPLYEHLRQAGGFHSFFPCGVGDIFPFDETAKRNPAAIIDIIKGGFTNGIHYFSTYASDSDVVRITGYLVKKSDIKKLASGNAVLQANAVWGLGEVKNSHVLDRKVRSL